MIWLNSCGFAEIRQLGLKRHLWCVVRTLTWMTIRGNLSRRFPTLITPAQEICYPPHPSYVENILTESPNRYAKLALIPVGGSTFIFAGTFYDTLTASLLQALYTCAVLLSPMPSIAPSAARRPEDCDKAVLR